MQKNEKLIIFDFNNLLHRSLHAYAGLNHQGVTTSGIYGFISLFCRQINKHKPARVLVCTDSPPYERKKLYPEYKSDRKEIDEEFLKDLKMNADMCKDFLSAINITLWAEKGMEADDLIALAVDEYYTQYKEIVIVSNDDDLYQLFKYPNVALQKGISYYDKNVYQMEYPNTTCSRWIDIQSMAGNHNGVPGIKGVGVKTAIKILDNPEKLEKIRKEHGAMLDIYKRVIRLPYTYDVAPVAISKACVDIRSLINKLSDWGIKLSSNFEEAMEQIAD